MGPVQEAPQADTRSWAAETELVEAPNLFTRAIQHSRVTNWGPPLIALILALVLWQVVVVLTKTPDYLIAKPTQMFSATGAEFGLLMKELVPTVIETVLGFAASVVIGLPLAILVIYSRSVGKAVYPLVVISQVVPKIAIAPIFVILIGTGLLPKVIVAFLIAFFPIVINGVTGMQEVDPDMLEMVRSMGAGKGRAFVKVRFPGALPAIFSGMKIALTLAVVGAVVAEFVGASKGLGYILLVKQGNVETDAVYAILLVMTVMGLVLYGILEIVEAMLLRGRKKSMTETVSKFSM